MNQNDQEKYANEILNKVLRDITSFVFEHCDLENKYLDSTYLTKYGHFEKGDVYVPKDEKIALLRLKKFVSLLKLLENNE